MYPIPRRLLIIALLSPAAIAAQSRPGFTPLDTAAAPASLSARISLALDKVPLRDVVSAIAHKSGASLTFDPSLPGFDRRVTLNVDGVRAAVALVLALRDTPIQAVVTPSAQIVLVPRPETPARAPLVGMVRDNDSPVSGAHVELVGTRFAAVSRGDGTFNFGVVPDGRYTLRVMRIGYRPLVREHVVLTAGTAPSPLVANLEAAAVPLAAVIVTPGYFGMLQPSIVPTQGLTRQQIETVPQIGDDIYRAVTRIPGVSANDMSAKFSVRGSRGDELYVTLDGLNLVEPFHLKDMASALSIIDSKALGSAELTTGGPSVEFGDQLAGVFAMRSLDPQANSAPLGASLSVMNARLMTQGSFAGDKGGWLVSARRGYLDLAMKLAGYDDSIIPRYDDLFAKLQFRTPDSGRIAFHVLRSRDRLTYIDRLPLPAIRSTYGSDYAWITWDAGLGSRLRQQSVLSTGRLTWQRNGAAYDRDTATLQIVHVGDVRHMSTAGLRQDWTLELSRHWLTKFGFDARHESAAYDYSSFVRREFVDTVSKLVSGRFDSSRVNASPSSDRLGVYVAQRVQPFTALTLEAGLRYDRASHTGDETLDPRFNASWQAGSRTTVRAGWGRHSQSQPIFGLDASDNVSQFFKAERENERVIGVEQALPFNVAARIEGYDRRVTSPRPQFLNPVFEIEAFPETNENRIRFAPDREVARGLEISLARDMGAHVEWSASYALAKFTDWVAGRAIPNPMDQRHTLHADWAYRPASNAWRLTVAGVAHSGWPYTPQGLRVDTLINKPPRLSWWNTVTTGELFAGRVPAYKRVDVRWTRFVDTKHGKLTIFAEVFNLFNNRNIAGYQPYSEFQAGRVAVLQESEDQVRRLPTAGIAWEF